MKRIAFHAIFTLTIHYSFGQACGLYRIKYVGKIISESQKIEKIKLPTIPLLHGLEDEDSEYGLIETELVSSAINIELNSHLTSHLFNKSDELLRFYQTKRDAIPIIIIVSENGKLEEKLVELTWDQIHITEQDDERFGNLFVLNLNEINIE